MQVQLMQQEVEDYSSNLIASNHFHQLFLKMRKLKKSRMSIHQIQIMEVTTIKELNSMKTSNMNSVLTYFKAITMILSYLVQRNKSKSKKMVRL